MENMPVIKSIRSAVNRYYVAMVIVAVLLILAGGYWFFVKSTVDRIRVVGVADIENKQSTIDQQQRTIGKLKTLKAQYESINYDQLRSMQSILPHQADLPYVILKLKQLIADNSLALQSIDTTPFTNTPAATASAAPVIQKLNITVSFKDLDTYAGLKNFLDQLSANVPFFELNALSYLPGNGSYTLNLTTYYQ
ncbi:MAG: type 4a pilus biogenesis protein PilO [Patescibacteria group bacterium]